MVTLSLKNHAEIKVLIAVSGNNLKSFAKEIDVSYSYFVNILHGNYNPSAKTAYKIAKALDKEITDLFNVEPRDRETN